jgi:hypothetical protein
MLKGTPPFGGSLEDVREAHLQKSPPPLPEAGGRLQAFVQQMLRKAPLSRPTFDRCVNVFKEAKNDEALEKAHPGLAAAAVAVASQRAQAEAHMAEAEARDREWAALQDEAGREMKGIVERLFGVITDYSDEAHIAGRTLIFGEGQLSIQDVRTVPRNRESGPNLEMAGWTVTSWSEVLVRSRSYIWAASLVYAAIPGDPSFRWREIGFWSWGGNSRTQPFSIQPNSRDFDYAVSTSITHSVNIAYGPFAIDAEDEPSFQKRCVSLLTKAATNSLVEPGSMPVPGAFWSS